MLVETVTVDGVAHGGPPLCAHGGLTGLDWIRLTAFDGLTACAEPAGFALNGVAASFTVSVSALETLAVSLTSPPYAAVMEWVPTVSVAVVSDALPPARDVLPRELPPSKKVTVPVGVPVPVGVTAAVNVTATVNVDGFNDDVSVVVVVAGVTVSTAGAEVTERRWR